MLYRVLTMTLLAAKQKLLDLKSEEDAIKDAIAMKNNALINDALLERERLRHERKMKVVKEANDEYIKVFKDFYTAQHKIEDKAAELMTSVLEAKVVINKK